MKTDRLLRCMYSAAGASCNNESATFVTAHDVWKFEIKLRPIEVLALVTAQGISIYNRPLLMITARC